MSAKRKDTTPPRGTKTKTILRMLQRPSGVTRAELLEKLEWPSINVYDHARARHLTVRTQRDGRTLRYFARPKDK